MSSPNDASEPACPHYEACSGCALPGIDPAAEAEAKHARLVRTVGRAVPGVEERINPLERPDSPFGHRSRLALRFDARGRRTVAGLPARESRGVTPIESCIATDPRAASVGLGVARDAIERRVEALRAVVAHAGASDDVHVTLIADTGRLPHAQRLAETAQSLGATGVSLNVHEGERRLFGRRTVPLAGRTLRVERIADLELPLGPTTFFESSRFGAERLVDAVRRLTPPSPKRIVDLYSGCGLLSLAVADRAGRTVQVDSSIEATRDAERCAGRLDADIDVRRAAVDRELTVLGDRPTDLAIVDPPPDGCPEDVVAQVARVLRPRRILLVGRVASTFARDLARFVANDMQVVSIDAIDVDPLARELVAVAALDR